MNDEKQSTPLTIPDKSGGTDTYRMTVDLNVLAGDTMLGPMLSKRDNAAAGDN